MKNNRILNKFVGDQLSRWSLACDNYRALKNVRLREMEIRGINVKLQFNPARIISSAAKLNKEDLAKALEVLGKALEAYPGRVK